MITFWHLAAVCCIPAPNPAARQREREVLRLAAQVQAKLAEIDPKKQGRWEAATIASTKKGRPAPKNSEKLAD